METITLFLTPEFDTIRDEMGYDENDDFDAYDILFQQGYDGEMGREGVSPVEVDSSFYRK